MPTNGFNMILPELFSSYKALGLSEAVSAIERARKAEEEVERARRAEEAERARKVVEAVGHKYGSRPLVTAAEKGDKEAVKALLVGGYKELEERGEYGNTGCSFWSKTPFAGCGEGSHGEASRGATRGTEDVLSNCEFISAWNRTNDSSF
jgi:hypothetical protein